MDPSLAHLMSWTEGTKGDVPPPLTGPTLTLSPLPAPHPPTVFAFGGKYVQTRRLTSEMWALNLATKTWSKVDAGTGPAPRYFHSMDTWEDKLVCFGGMSDAEPMSVHGDIWFFDCVQRKWLAPPAPHPGIAQDPANIPAARYAHLSAVTRGKLILMGGQDHNNAWIYEINVYDLRRHVWSSKTMQPELRGMHSKGAYRSLMTGGKRRVIQPIKGGDVKGSAPLSYSIEEEGEGGDLYCYSNYDFAKVRRELDIISPDPDDEAPSIKYAPPPTYTARDESRSMRGTSQPPGLRFPTGGIVGNHLILCGLYLASSSSAYSIWAMDLTQRTWRHIEPAALANGSWNRAVLWADAAKLLVFGNTQYNIAEDYSKRSVNLDNVAVISLEAYGIYTPPPLEISAKVQELGLTMLDEKLASDFEVVSEDGRKVKCSRRLLSERWPWFAEQERRLLQAGEETMEDAPALDITDTLLGGFGKAVLAPTHLTIKEAFPVCIALVQYFYTLNLATPLQNRAPVITELLFLAKQYRIERLAKLAVHALHERLDMANASHMYEIATLAGEQDLQVRCLLLAHASKGAAHRAHRPGPAGTANADSPSAAGQQNMDGSTGPAGSSGTGAAQGGQLGSMGQGHMPQANYRQMRAESPTLGGIYSDNEDEVETDNSTGVAASAEEDENVDEGTTSADGNEGETEHISELLNAIALAEPIARPESPVERAIPRAKSMHLPPSRPPPLLPLPAPPIAASGSSERSPTAPSSPSSPTKIPLPPTPITSTPLSPLSSAASIPIREKRFSGRSSVQLETLPESSEMPMIRTPRHLQYPSTPIRFTPSALSTTSWDQQSIYSACPSLTTASSLAQSTRHDSVITDFPSEYEISSAYTGRRQAPQPLVLNPSHNVQYRSPYNHLADAQSPSSSSFPSTSGMPATPATPHSGFGLFPPPDYTQGKGGQTALATFARQLQASAQAQVEQMSMQSLGKHGTQQNSLSPTSRRMSMHSAVSGADMSRTPSLSASTAPSAYDSSFMVSRDALSVSSGSTGMGSLSSKKMQKLERKMIAQAEKENRKAEQQAKFETLRADQQRKMALSRAEAQRKAEIEAALPKAPKKEPKGKLGKLGAKFTDAVLFPEGGKNSTFF